MDPELQVSPPNPRVVERGSVVTKPELIVIRSDGEYKNQINE